MTRPILVHVNGEPVLIEPRLACIRCGIRIDDLMRTTDEGVMCELHYRQWWDEQQQAYGPRGAETALSALVDPDDLPFD